MYTLGIEEELFAIDPQTLALVSITDNTLAKLNHRLHRGSCIKHEYYDCQVEINTQICNNIKVLKKNLTQIHQILFENARKLNLMILASSTHPLISWKDCHPTKNTRYQQNESELQYANRQLLVCGLQFHVSVPDPTLRYPLINNLRKYLPCLLALSTSSPFWEGIDTGLMSYRTLVIGNLPRTGLPPCFPSMTDFQDYLQVLITTNTIRTAKDIWWDIRPHPIYPTIECRICDTIASESDTIALAALFQGLVAKEHQTMTEQSNSSCKDNFLIIQENKWRAARYGLQGKFIDYETNEEITVKAAIHKILVFIDDVIDELGIRQEINHISAILENGTSAHRQLTMYQETGNLEAVIGQLTGSSSTD